MTLTKFRISEGLFVKPLRYHVCSIWMLRFFCNLSNCVILYGNLFVYFKLELRVEKEKVEKLEKSICEASEDAQKQVHC